MSMFELDMRSCRHRIDIKISISCKQGLTALLQSVYYNNIGTQLAVKKTLTFITGTLVL